MTCTQQNCRARLCPGKSFSIQRQKKCTNSMFTFTKAKREQSSSDLIYSGEAVALLPYDSVDTIINCADSSLCRVDHICTDDTEPYQYCDRQLSIISVPGRQQGESIIDGDLIELRPIVSLNNDLWIGCDVNNTRKCRRFDCNEFSDNDSTQTPVCEEFFVLFIL